MLSIKVSGDAELEDALLAVYAAIDTEQILDEASAVLLARIRARFLKEVDPDGVPWIPSFAAMRRKRTGRGGGTLFNTGHLFHSIQLFGEGMGHRDIGTDVPYAHKHQYGWGQGEEEIGVVRRFLGINEDDARIIEKSIYNRISEALEGKIP